MQALLAQLGARAMFANWRDLPDYDAFVPLSGLPRLAGTRVDTIPAPVPYLQVNPTRAARWKTRLDDLVPPDLRRIGLAWAGRPSHNNDHRRSTSLEALRPLFAMKDVVFVSLQKGERQAEIARYHGAAPLLNLGPELASWDDTAAVLATLDAVVTVDTGVAHLGGALGRSVHLLLPHVPDWRWLLGRDDTPWYPTMRLHRQPAAGDWEAIAESVLRHLAQG